MYHAQCVQYAQYVQYVKYVQYVQCVQFVPHVRMYNRTLVPRYLATISYLPVQMGLRASISFSWV